MLISVFWLTQSWSVFLFSLAEFAIMLRKVGVTTCLAPDEGILYMVIFILLRQLKLFILNNNKAMIKLIKGSSEHLSYFYNPRFPQWRKAVISTSNKSTELCGPRKAKELESLRFSCGRTSK